MDFVLLLCFFWLLDCCSVDVHFHTVVDFPCLHVMSIFCMSIWHGKANLLLLGCDIARGSQWRWCLTRMQSSEQETRWLVSTLLTWKKTVFSRSWKHLHSKKDLMHTAVPVWPVQSPDAPLQSVSRSRTELVHWAFWFMAVLTTFCH